MSQSEIVSTCKQTCEKEKECFGAEASFLDCDTMCSPDNLQKKMGTSSNEKCDWGQLRSKMEGCLSVECKDLESCMEEASSVCKAIGSPDSPADAPVGASTPPSGAGTPPSGTGTPSTGTSAPPSGTTTPPSGVSKPPAGSDTGGSGSSDCAVCERAATCCAAVLKAAGQDASTCDTFSKASCESLPAAAQSQFAQVCSQTLDQGAGAGIAECE